VNRRPFVLVHGAWHAGWCWGRVASVLRERGHLVYAPTLPGLGPDGNRLDATHTDGVRALSAFVEERDLRDIVVVAHSWGGYPVCSALPAIADRVAHVIFWNALVPLDGESVLDTAPPEIAAHNVAVAAARGDNSIPLEWEQWRSNLMTEGSDELARLIFDLLTPQPLGTFAEKPDVRAFYELDLPRAYIHGLRDLALPPGEYGWSRHSSRARPDVYLELDIDHEALFTAPAELVRGILAADEELKRVGVPAS
jgi:pimeloyl-ACP methyl ester carboxylesterase